MSKKEIAKDILTAIGLGITVVAGIAVAAEAENRSGRVEIKKRRPVRKTYSIQEVMLPSNAGTWDEQVLVDVNDIRGIRTRNGFDYYLILDMYDGTEIKLKYSFASNMKKDLSLIMEMRQVPSYRYRFANQSGFAFQF